jgi:hypothetical protein
MRATTLDIDHALSDLRRAVDRLSAVLCSRKLKIGMPVHDQQELVRREIATRQWIDDPNGFRAGVGPADYRVRCGL